MILKEVRIVNETGLHARPASMIVKSCSEVKAKIELVLDGKAINAKSILSIISAGISYGDKITIKADGEDAQEAMDSLLKLFESGFGEL